MLYRLSKVCIVWSFSVPCAMCVVLCSPFVYWLPLFISLDWSQMCLVKVLAPVYLNPGVSVPQFTAQMFNGKEIMIPLISLLHIRQVWRKATQHLLFYLTQAFAHTPLKPSLFLLFSGCRGNIPLYISYFTCGCDLASMSWVISVRSQPQGAQDEPVALYWTLREWQRKRERSIIVSESNGPFYPLSTEAWITDRET